MTGAHSLFIRPHLVLLGALLCAPPLLGDVIHLKDGRTYAGTLAQETDDSIVFLVKKGTIEARMTFRRAEVERFETTASMAKRLDSLSAPREAVAFWREMAKHPGHESLQKKAQERVEKLLQKRLEGEPGEDALLEASTLAREVGSLELARSAAGRLQGLLLKRVSLERPPPHSIADVKRLFACSFPDLTLELARKVWEAYPEMLSHREKDKDPGWTDFWNRAVIEERLSKAASAAECGEAAKWCAEGNLESLALACHLKATGFDPAFAASVAYLKSRGYFLEDEKWVPGFSFWLTDHIVGGPGYGYDSTRLNDPTHSRKFGLVVIDDDAVMERFTRPDGIDEKSLLAAFVLVDRGGREHAPEEVLGPRCRMLKFVVPIAGVPFRLRCRAEPKFELPLTVEE
ncbi:MAG: hypothetical protein HYY93_11060 [Planctomycetes bacterium]|nr:hypothetical protein [Planctomycetota bacterium]